MLAQSSHFPPLAVLERFRFHYWRLELDLVTKLLYLMKLGLPATAVRDVGATPIFCDVDISTYNMDVNDCSAKITKLTKAILPVHVW